jgi:hypothetical protein
MQSNNHFSPLFYYDLYSQTFLSFTILPSQNFIQYPDPKLQIQNSRKLESKFPIKNSDNFTVEITEKNGEKKKYGLEDLAKIVPDDFSEGVLSPQIENNKLKIVTNKKIDESYSNKILIKTGDDSYAVIPSHLIDKAREEEKRLKMEEAKIGELFSFNDPRIWGTPYSQMSFFDPSIYQTYDRGSGMAPPGVTLVPGGTIRISNNSQSNDQGPITVKVNNSNNAR